MAAVDKRPPQKVGVPLTLTKKLGTAICKRMEQGAPFNWACRAEGVSDNTAQEWVRRGEGRDDRPATPLFVWFAKEKHKARAKFVQARIKQIADDPSWQASAWTLERMYPEDFGRPADRIELSGQGGGAIQVTLAFDPSPIVAAVAARRALQNGVIEVNAEEIE